MSNRIQRALAVSLFAVTLGVSLSGCGAFGGATPAPDGTNVPVVTETATATPSESSTEEAVSSDAEEAATAITGFFSAVKSETKSLLAEAPDGKYDPSLSTFDQDYSLSYSYIDRNEVNTSDAAKLVYSFGAAYTAEPEMYVSVDAEDVSVDETGEAYVSGGNLSVEIDGKVHKSESVDSGAFFLHKVGDEWLINYVDLNDGTK